MKAAILVEQHEPLVIADIDIPALTVGQVLIEVAYTGICGKQIDEITGKRGEDPYLPHLLGHEAAGVVMDIGPGVSKVKQGDHVVMHWMKGSGIDSKTPQFTWGDRVVNAGCITTFSEHAIVSENRVTLIPKDVDLEAASLLGCAVTTGLGIVCNDAGLKPGQSIAMFGIGGVGLNVLQGAALVNAYPIVAIDRYEHKLEQARAFGATHTLLAGRDDVEKELKELSNGAGFDVTVDSTGDTQVFQTAYAATHNEGKTIMAGVLHHQKPITIDPFALHFGRNIIGSHGGDTRPDVDISRYIELYQRGKLKLEEQITHRHSFDEINQAIESIRHGRVGRCVLSVAA